jgi:hypothetical protein
MTDLQPGDFGVLNVPAHSWRNRFTGALIRGATASPYDHAITYLDTDGSIGEAVGAGYRIAKLSAYDGVDILWSSDALQLTVPQRAQCISAALKLASANNGQGVPYGFPDIAELSLTLLAKRRAPKWVLDRLNDGKTMICSQAVAFILHQAGIDLYPDKTFGEVTPGDLGRWIWQHKQLAPATI